MPAVALGVKDSKEIVSKFHLSFRAARKRGLSPSGALGNGRLAFLEVTVMADDPHSILSAAESRMKKAVEAVHREFAAVRTGRASAALVEGLTVEYYGSAMPLNQLANISASDARTLEIKPWDANALAEIEKAVRKSDLGLTPNNDGKVIRISIPPLTEERRRDLVKVVRKQSEEGRVAVRAIRQDANKELERLKREKKISEDDVKKAQDRVQKITDRYVEEINQAVERKEKEILEV